MNRSVAYAAAFTAFLCSGCLSLTTDETRTMEEIGRSGFSLETPPAGFVPPVGSYTAAGLNALPGIGNFYLATHGGGNWQWALGAGNLLLWPFSPLWAVCEGYADARTVNSRSLVRYWNDNPGLAARRPEKAKPLHHGDKAGTESPEWAEPRAPTAVPSPAAPGPAPYQIVGIEPQEGGRYVVRVEIGDRSKTFAILNAIKLDVKRLVREDFASQRVSVRESDIRENLQYRTENDGRFLVFTGWAFSARPLPDGWTYDAATRRGTIRLRVSGSMPPEEAKRWARENITAIVTEKNVVLRTGRAPPDGATFRSLDETFSDGILSVEFEAVQ